jgi:1,2-diacylglycerol 3-alpha-glucosyltransferase
VADLRKLNIAMIAACPFPANRGTPSRIKGMAESLTQLGHKVHIVTYHFGIDVKTKCSAIHRIPNLPYTYLGPGPTLSKLMVLDPLLFWRTYRVVRQERTDIIHAHHFEAALIGYLVRKLTGTKVIYDAHTILKSELQTYKFVKWPWAADFIEKSVPRWADHIISVSQTIYNVLVSMGIEKSRINVIPTGVNLEDFEKSDAESIRTRFGLHEKQIVMYAGSLAPFQRIDYLVQAMSRVLRTVDNTILFMVVDAFDQRIERLCYENGLNDKVIFAVEPKFDRVPTYLAAADVVVVPRTECSGIPQKLTNYMAAEKAVVCFESSGKVLVNNQNGLVVSDGDTTELADAITRLLRHRTLREQLGKNAKASVVGRYDWPSLAKRIEEIYSRVLEPEGARF